MDKYPDYREVSSDWIHAVPSHWKEETLIQVAENQQIKNKGMAERNLLSLSYGKIIQKDINRTDGLLPASFEGYQIVQNGNIILRLTDLQNDHKSLRTGLVTQTGIITSAYTCLKVRGGILPAYLHLLLHSADLHKVFYGMGGGVRQSIGYKDIRYMPIIVPPIKEQDQIVRFLDWKISSISHLISNKSKQIKRYKKLLQSEIEQQIRKYPILQECRLKELGRFYKGGGFSRENLVESSSFPALLYGDIYTQYEYETSSISHFIDEKTYLAANKIIDGDIVMTGTGETKDEIGKPILYSGSCPVAVGGDVIVFRPNCKSYKRYILYQLYSNAAFAHRYVSGKGDIIVHISPSALGNIKISLPSLDNQIKASDQIFSMISFVKNICQKIEEEILALKKLKDSVVSEVVTGKIDVRNVVIPEYEYTPEEGSADGVDDEEMEEEVDDNV